MDYKKILEGVVDIINTTEKSDIGFANICAYIGENYPEIKESEDKKMVKFIKNQLFNIKKTITDNYKLDTELTKAIDWLEKRGEQKPADTEKGTNGNEREIPNLEPPLTIKHAKEVMGIKQDDAWSEEDEKMFDYALNMIDWYGCVDKDKSKPVSDWFKSLKYRIQPQPNPKQEWSEEDEKCLENAIMYCKWARDIAPNLYCYETSEKSINWLKSLKERYTWKPSDEQMEALNRAMYHVEDDVATQIAKLIGDLKKLREK